MDKVRFGRALGYGARHAAKALTQAVDAATTPSAPTSASASRPLEPARPSARPVSQTVADAGRTVFEVHRNVQNTKSQVKHAAKMAGKSAFAPVAKFSSVLWLEVTGTFFGLVAFAMGEAVWKLRANFHLASSAPGARNLYLCVVICLVFVYFAVSSFVRASRRQKQ
jgi:hypothetical protein